MVSPRDYWLEWVEALRRYELDGLVLWLLEVGRPLALLSAQLMYMGRPFLGTGVEALARMLESDTESRAFAALLDREKAP